MTLDFDDAITPTYGFGCLADVSPDRLQALRQLTHEHQESVRQSLSVITDELALATSLQAELADATASELNECITERTTCAMVDGEVRGVLQDVQSERERVKTKFADQGGEV